MDYELEKFLKEKYNGKKIEEKYIRDTFQVNDYEEYAKIIKKLTSDKIIKGVKSQGNNGMIPPLYKIYQVEKERKDYSEYILEIKLLSPLFNVEDYIKRVEKYVNNREWILKLDKFLKEKYIELKEELSINERSFQIFGEEKFLKENYKAIFEINPLLEKELNFYKTPEPFFSYDIDIYKNELKALIFENKDTWYSFGKFLKENKNIKKSFQFDVLIYGEGKKITRNYDSLTEFSETKYRGKSIEYFYFGDIDFEGIKIYENLKKVNPNLKIQLMNEFYKELIERSRGKNLPKTKDKQIEILEGVFFDEIKSDIEYVKEILKNRNYIPQELLNYKVIKELGVENE